MIRVRPYRREDAPALAEIFFRAVHEGAVDYYTARERAAWAPRDALPPDWADRLGRQMTQVAETDGFSPAGFMTLGHDGHLDLAYVAPEAMGTGVAAALYDRLLVLAREAGMTRLETEASHLARRFFLKQGWAELTRQQVERDGVLITNFRMEKYLR